MIANFLDWSGVAIPNGVGKDTMPTSLLLSATRGHDAAILSAGLSLELIIRIKEI
jgi:Asp-tRNA(Asn)/Glu-tRNA(Gln) amidotransferase A subunit family amidase